MIYLGCFQIYLAAFKFEYNGTEKGVLPYLVGVGIMSATLALLVKQLKPDLNVLIVERLDKVAQ